MLTDVVEMLNTPVVDPADTVTLDGTAATPGSPLDNATTAPPDGAAAVSVTTPCAPVPPVTLDGDSASDCIVTAPAWVVTASAALLVVPLYDAVIVTLVFAATGDVVMVAVPVNPLAGTATVGGTLATCGLLLESAITAPPSGAPVLSTTVVLDALPPTTDEGFVSIVDSVAGGGAVCGVKLRTADHAPAAPAELTPRTRQKCVVVASPLVA